jgi:hypothetical protein
VARAELTRVFGVVVEVARREAPVLVTDEAVPRDLRRVELELQLDVLR